MAEVAVVVVAAGRGSRVGGDLPKQFRPIGGEPMIRQSLTMLVEHPRGRRRTAGDPSRRCGDVPILGGRTSIFFRRYSAGVPGKLRCAPGWRHSLPAQPDIVLIHDAARPFASAALVSRAIAAAERSGAAIPALPVTDTVKTVDAAGLVDKTLDRNTLRLVQTPQSFAFSALLAAHRRAAAAGRDGFHRRRRARRMGRPQGQRLCRRARQHQDHQRRTISRAPKRRNLPRSATCAPAPASTCTLSAPAITSLSAASASRIRQALIGHSDADVVLHALTDAVLGALADGDIGVHFPPSDPQWRGASSDRFLTFAIERLAKRGGRIAHIDINIVCEAPRIGPHRDAMRAKIARLAGIAASIAWR